MTKEAEFRKSQLCIDPFLETLNEQMLQAFRLKSDVGFRIAVLSTVLPPAFPIATRA